MNKCGFVGGKHYTTYIDYVRQLKRRGDLELAEQLLKKLIPAVEAQAKVDGLGVPPWWYKQLAIICAKKKDLPGELAILERYERQGALPGGWLNDDLANRLAKIRQKLNQNNE